MRQPLQTNAETRIGARAFSMKRPGPPDDASAKRSTDADAHGQIHATAVAAAHTPLRPAASAGSPETPAPALPRWLEGLGLVLFLMVWGGTMAGLAVLRTSHPEPLHGDSFSDAAHLIAGWNYDRHGLLHRLGLPQFWEFTDHPPGHPYITFPPGPYLLIQVYKALGLGELWQFRAAALLWTALAGLLVMVLATRLSGSTFVGALATFFYLGSAPFLEYADSLAYHSYSQATLVGTLLAWVAYEQAAGAARRRIWLSLACTLFFLDGWLTLEHMPFIVAFAGLRTLWLRQFGLWRGCALLWATPLVVLGLRVAHVSLALGDVRGVVAQVRAKVMERAGLESPEHSYRTLLRTWYRRLCGEATAPQEYDYAYRYPLLVRPVRYVSGALLVVFLCLWHAPRLVAARRALCGGVALVFCGSLWLLLMVQHATIHRHLILLLLPGLALLLGALAAAGFLTSLALPRTRSPARVVGPLLGLGLLASFAAELRGAMAVNLWKPLDPAVRAHWDTTQAAYERLRAFAAANPQVKFVAIRNAYPVLAWLLGRNFRVTSGPDVPELGPDGLFWVQCWGEVDKPVIPPAARRYGLPDMFSPHLAASNMHLIFRGERVSADRVELEFEAGLRITRLRVAPAIDGESWYVQALLEGPLRDVRCDDLTFYCHLLDAEGHVLRYADTRVAWGAADADGAVLWTTLRRSEVSSRARLRLGLWCPQGSHGPARTLRLSAAPAGLAGEVRVDDSLEGFVWRPPAWDQSTP